MARARPHDPRPPTRAYDPGRRREYLVTGALALALLLTAGMYRQLGRMAGTPRAGIVAIVPQLVLGSMCVSSVINGADGGYFNAVAPVCLVSWFGASAVIARGLRRTNAVPKAIAYALPLLLVANFLLSPLGGAMLSGAFWIVVGARMAGVTPQPAVQPA